MNQDSIQLKLTPFEFEQYQRGDEVCIRIEDNNNVDKIVTLTLPVDWARSSLGSFSAVFIKRKRLSVVENHSLSS